MMETIPTTTVPSVITPPPIDYTARVVTDIPPPIAHRLDHDQLFKSDGTVDLAVLQRHLYGEGKLFHEDVEEIINRCTELLSQEPTLLAIEAPITVCGDVHGQYYDLIKLFEVGGNPSETNYLFLGDYVDRGSFAIEVLLHLYSCKINYPKTFFLIRGNHECRHLTEYFTFKEECLHKYNEDIYELALKSFNSLPLAATINGKFLCIHGGISPEIKTIADIANIDRFREPPQSGPMCDLLWADPMEDFSPEVSEFFQYNEVRGCSYLFSYRAVCAFLENNKLLSVIRAHEAQDAGYKMHLKNKVTGFPTVITIFSAPNYLDAYNNKGAVLRYESNVMNIRQFNHAPHPYWLPNFMDVFTWSLPFVAEKVAEMLLTFLHMVDDAKEEAKEEAANNQRALETDSERRERLRAKVRSVSKMMRMYAVLRAERETIMHLKSITPGRKIPQGLLTRGPEALRTALGNFNEAKLLDQVNERRPPLPG